MARRDSKKSGEIEVTGYELTPQANVRVPLITWTSGKVVRVDRLVIEVMEDESAMDKMELPKGNSMIAYVTTPRGAERLEEKKQAHVRRRYALIGQTVEGMRVYDVRRAVQAARKLPGVSEKTAITLRANGAMAGVALYAALFEPGVTRLELQDLPASHVQGPQLLNVLRIMDVPAAVAMAAERATVVLEGGDAEAWAYPKEVAAAMKWPADRLQIAGPK